MEAVDISPILVDRVYERLANAIADWSLRPGQRIVQADLAADLGVSRQPVSHALVLLKQQGLVQDAGRKGLEVAPIDPLRIRQLYEVRAVLDALAARLAATLARDGTLPAAGVDAMTRACDAGQALCRDAPLAALVAADLAYHQTVYRLSGNPAVRETLAAQLPHLRRSMMAVLETAEYRERAWAEHAEIMRLILAGQAEDAAQIAHQHAENAGRETERRLLLGTCPAVHVAPRRINTGLAPQF